MKVFGINCSDWHRGWGSGQYNNIGKLSKIDENTYQYRGHKQGRHGQKWNSGINTIFKVLEDGSFEYSIENKSNILPDKRDVLQAIETLNKSISVRQVRLKRKTIYHSQLSLNF